MVDDPAAAAREVLAHVRQTDLAGGYEVLAWICAIAPDDLRHVRPNCLHATLIAHKEEKAARAVIMPVEAFTVLATAAQAGPGQGCIAGDHSAAGSQDAEPAGAAEAHWSSAVVSRLAQRLRGWRRRA